MITADNTGGELRSRGGSRNNPQSGDEDENIQMSCSQNVGWLRSKASRFGKMGKRAPILLALIAVMLVLVTMIVAIPLEDMKMNLVSCCCDQI